jgi:hypothetical protein
MTLVAVVLGVSISIAHFAITELMLCSVGRHVSYGGVFGVPVDMLLSPLCTVVRHTQRLMSKAINYDTTQ